MKDNLVVSFSGGESSAMMVKLLLDKKKEEYNMNFVFMNTSKEREETLIFADKVDKLFGLGLVWIEATFDKLKGIGYDITNFKDAKRNGEVFESMIKCYGLPNNKYPHCSRELKLQPFDRYVKDNFKDYKVAIGIRCDEVDRINSKWKVNKLYYPLIEFNITKQHVNKFWYNQPFRLNLKGYQGNCNLCWKKSTRKLLTIINEGGDEWWNDMENKYKRYVPNHRKRGKLKTDLSFFRSNLTYDELKKLSKHPFNKAKDDSIDYDIQESLFGYDLDDLDGCSESCEII